MRKVTKGAVTMKLWDVGGQKRFRTMWERYCRGVQAIVYVVDAADHDTLDESSALLLELMQRPSVQGIPLLVLGNKNDVPNALNSEDLRDRMCYRFASSRSPCYQWVFLPAEISIRSPRKLFIFIILKKNLFWINVSKRTFNSILKTEALLVT